MTPPQPIRATPWSAGIATGIGSMPGSDPARAAAIIAGELPDLPHLAELPARGVGADMIGRALAICVDMPGEVVPSGWRLASRPGRDTRRGTDFLAWDLDAAAQAFAGAPWLKVQVAGPWTLAAQVETPRGHRALTDPGAVRDLAASLTEGLRQHLADLARRLPGTRIVVQLDEPSLPQVLAGSLRTASGLMTVAAVPEPDARQLLTETVSALDGHLTVAHCCGARVPTGLVHGAGFDALSADFTSLPTDAAQLDPIGEAVESGVVIWAGLVTPTRGSDAAAAGRADASVADATRPADPGSGKPPARYDFRAAAAPVVDLWRRLGLPEKSLARVVVTPTCGLADSIDPVADLRYARDVARYLAELSER